jgi:hypothetical protein
MREARKKRAIPFKEWWQAERRRIQAKETMATAVVDMWRQSMELSPGYAQELRAFWGFADDFVF